MIYYMLCLLVGYDKKIATWFLFNASGDIDYD